MIIELTGSVAAALQELSDHNNNTVEQTLVAAIAAHCSLYKRNDLADAVRGVGAMEVSTGESEPSGDEHIEDEDE
jgi:hypothetical protein